VLGLAGALVAAPLAAQPTEAAPAEAACPQGVPPGARCLRGQDSASSHYLIVMPARWSGVLVVHAHGGPALGPPKVSRADEDIKRWAITVELGHAWAGSVFRQGGFAVTTAAEDTERVRRIFLQHVAQPRRTLLHGQSWGAMVAARAGELFPASWDAILLTSGVVAGPATYDFRLDLRVIYQHLCRNHPRPDEPSYPLWMGLPEGSTMTQADLAVRTRECLGLGLPAAQRTPEQARKLKAIAALVRVPESSVQGHLNWGTFHFREIAQRRGGKPVFGNIGAVYAGSGDEALDREINASVPRYAADPEAVRAFAADTDLEGRIGVPVLSLHAVNDPVAFVELQHHFRGVMQRGGSGDRLVQVYTEHAEHSYLADALYGVAVQQLLAWAEGGAKPSPASMAAACDASCRLVGAFEPLPLERRVPARQRP
jgi:pimeloyl-ACP methyl ester carboxylesterase